MRKHGLGQHVKNYRLGMGCNAVPCGICREHLALNCVQFLWMKDFVAVIVSQLVTLEFRFIGAVV